MARDQSTAAAGSVDSFREAMERRIAYRLEEDETPVGGLNPHHKYYEESGSTLFQIVRNHLHITKDDKVLEIGCGTGRVSTPFVKYLGSNYHGFDNNAHFVKYCRSLGPNNYQHVDVFHDDWNPSGSIDPLQLEFPYRDRQFSAVFSIAVFQHFRAAWFERYVAETARILNKGGRLFFTLVIAAEPKIERLPPFQFSHRTEHEWYDYRDTQLYNVALPERAIRRVFISNGLMIQDPIKYGSWNKSPLAITGYDVIIAHKRK